MSNLQSIYRYSADPQAEPRAAGRGDTVNPDLSSSLDDPYSNSLGGYPLSIVLIGPDEERRQMVFSALAECPGGEIREFPSYPESLDEVPQLLEQDYDVVIIDLDSSPEYALELVESICVNSPATVMVYSMRGNPELLVRCMRAGAREFLPLPITHSIMGEALTRAAVRRPATRSRKKSMGRLLVFLGAKGGDGVTTLACNFAVALALESGQSTLLIDLDLPLGDAALNLGITAEYSTLNALQSSGRLDSNFFSKLLVKHSSGLSVLSAPGKFPQFQASGEAVDRLLEVARKDFDNVIVDMGSRLDLVDTSLFREGSTVYLVVQASIAGLRNSNRLISQLFMRSVPKLEIVINRFETRSMGFSEDQISKALTRPAQWKIPNDYAAVQRMQHTTVPLAMEDSPIARLIRRMARTACGLPPTPEKSIGFSLKSLWGGLAGKSSTPKANTPTLKQGPAAAPAGSSSGQNGASAAPVAAQTGSSANISARSPLKPLAGSLPNAETPAPWTPADSVVLTEMAACTESVEAKRAALQLVNAPSPQDEQNESEMRLGGVAAPVKEARSEWRPRKIQPCAVNRETPTIQWPTPDAISYDDVLGEAQLNARASVPGAFTYIPAAGEQLAAGSHTLSVTFTPDETARYAAAQAEVTIEVTIEVARETPTIQWPAPDAITYGDVLSEAQLNARASVPGAFTYIPAAGEQLAAGSHMLSVTFTPDETARYAAAQAEVAIEVARETPTIQWPTPDAISYDDVLGEAQLNARASVPGVFAYIPAAGEQLAAGSHTLSVTFTPDETARYAAAQAEVAIEVARETPTIQWPAPDAITYGDVLSEAQLNARASVPGVLTYIPAAGEQLAAGSHTLSVTFTPDETARYAAAQAEVSIEVARETPTIQWPAPDAITYGDALSDVQLNARASVLGVFAYTPFLGSMLAAGTHTPSVIFTPDETANYISAQAAVSLTVAKATPAIIWLTPATIPYGAALGEAELNATASVPGKFVYTPAAGTVLAAGTHALSVVFTPADTTDYAEAQATVSLTVTEAPPIVIAWPTPVSIPYGTALSETELNATASVPGATSYTPAAGEMLVAGRHTLAVIFTPEDGNLPAAQAEISLTVTKAQSVITWPEPVPISYGAVLTDAQLNAMASIPGSFVYAPAAGVALDAGKHTLSAIFTPEESANYTEGQAIASLTVSKATPLITWPAPDPISYGTALGEAQLNATALIPGAFVYSPVAGTVMAAGIQRLSVAFTPADSTDYATAEASVPLVVEGLPNLASLMPAAADAEVETEACHFEQERGDGFAETERWKLERLRRFQFAAGQS